MARNIYKSNGGEITCSPNQSCEGETPDLVILKDSDGHPVAEVVLSAEETRDPKPGMAQAPQDQPNGHVHGDSGLGSGLITSSDGSMAGAFCNIVAVLTLVGGLGSVLVAMDTYDPDPAGIAFGFGAAASSAPIFAIGSIANSTRRSALIAQQMAELMAQQEERRHAATPDA